MKLGEVWWASLPSPTGSGPGFRRPVLIVQANAFNQSKISTVVVAVVTSNLALENAPGNVRMSKSESGLSKPSVVNVSQIITIDRTLLTKRVKPLSGKALNKVQEGLRLVLAL